MQFFARSTLLILTLAIFCFAVDSPVLAQGKGEKVRFTSVDGVELHGLFYPAGKRNSPTVIMLHPLNEDSRKATWVALAEKLNQAGFAVLTFDFRGHGHSIEIDPAEFFKYKANINGVKGAGPKKVALEYKDMFPAYFPVLVNDIAAAKAFLDHRNDTGVCNTASTIVLGADTGATLGALWLNSECYRHRLDPPTMIGFLPVVAPRAEGRDVIGGIWITPSTKLGSRSVGFSNLVGIAGREFATPMVFLYSDGDEAGKKIALNCEKAIRGPKKDEKKFPLTGAVDIKGGGKLSGTALLTKSLGADKAIVEYIKSVFESKGNDWGEREFRKTQYIWKFPTRTFPAKNQTEKTFVFDTYEKFIP
ncbi:MAG: hypothetical protein L0Y72_05985 [Gemmataceae bacterium]|nr:hypothetical protein [Gemmataceae bacterium]MCI0738575.1 hypothetical protein [Gemmataceae bacterium]